METSKSLPSNVIRACLLRNLHTGYTPRDLSARLVIAFACNQYDVIAKLFANCQIESFVPALCNLIKHMQKWNMNGNINILVSMCCIDKMVLLEAIMMSPDISSKFLINHREYCIESLSDKQLDCLYKVTLIFGCESHAELLVNNSLVIPKVMLPFYYYTKCPGAIARSIKFVKHSSIHMDHVMILIKNNLLTALESIVALRDRQDIRQLCCPDHFLYNAAAGHLDLIKWYHDICQCDDHNQACIFDLSFYNYAENAKQEHVVSFLKKHTRCLHRPLRSNQVQWNESSNSNTYRFPMFYPHPCRSWF